MLNTGFPRRLAYGSPVNWQCPLTRGLMAWYLVLPQRYGGLRWLDLVGRNHGALTNMGASSATSGWGSTTRPGGAGGLRFDGTNDLVDAGASSAVTGVKSLTISLWFLASNVHDFNILLARWNEASGQRVWAIALFADGTLHAYSSIDGTNVTVTNLASATVFSANQWYHIVVIYDDTDVTTGRRIYVNGRLDASGVLGGLFTSSTPLLFGSSPQFAGSVQYFAGMQDDCAIYQRVLSAAEITQLYADSRTFHPRMLRRVGLPWGKPAAGAVGNPWYHHRHNHAVGAM